MANETDMATARAALAALSDREIMQGIIDEMIETRKRLVDSPNDVMAMQAMIERVQRIRDKLS
jgi:chloramphenicol 3-O-phosphotransferase